MIALLPGHHSGALGATNGTHSEHAEACLLVAMLATRLDASIITGTTTQKIEQLEQIRPDIAIELHFGSNKLESTSGQLFVAANSSAHLHVNKFVAAVGGTIGAGVHRSGSVDFFLMRSPVPSLLVTIDDFTNFGWIEKNRVTTCNRLMNALSTLGE